MKINLYAIKDLVSGHASVIMTANNDKQLERNLMVMFQQKQINFINDHPEDKQVYKVGTFDTESMVNIACVPELVISVSEIEEKVLSYLRQQKEKLKDLLTEEQKGQIDGEINRIKGE